MTYSLPGLLIAFYWWFNLLSIADACDGNACCYDSDCGGSRYCPRGGGVTCKCADQWFAKKFNYGQCVSRKNKGESCNTDSNCKSGDCMNNNVLAAGGCAAVCGPSDEGGPCERDSNCGSGFFCKGGQSLISCGKCQRKFGNGEGTCTTDDDCRGGDCRGLSCAIPSSPKTCAYAFCYESPGWPVGTFCTEDRDCDQSKAWCKGGGIGGQIGRCAACPAKCGNRGCNACNNDENKMRCGKTTDLTKVNCAAEVAAEAAQKVLAAAFECLGLDPGVGDCLITAAKTAGSCLTGGSCRIQFGYPSCSTIATKEFLSGDLEETDFRRLKATDSLAGTWGQEESNFFTHDFGLTEHLAFEGRILRSTTKSKSTLTTKGKLSVSGGFLFVLDPKEGIMEFKTKLEATADALAKFVATSTTTNSKRDKRGKPAGPKKVIFSKFILVGKFPVQIAVTIQPYVWIDYTTKGTFTASASVQKKATMTGSLTVKGLLKQVEAGLKWTDSPLTTTVTSEGTFDASFTYRLGVKVAVSFNGFKASADAAFALKASANLALQGACLSGTFGIGASADVSSNVVFETPDLKAAAQAACLAGVNILLGNPVGAVANCIGKLTTGKDAKKELEKKCSEIDDDPSRDIPESSCSTDAGLSVGDDGKWTSFPIAQAQITVEGLCLDPTASPIAKTSASNIFTPPAGSCRANNNQLITVGVGSSTVFVNVVVYVASLFMCFVMTDLVG